MEFGMPYLFETPSIQEACRLASALGFSFVELNTNFPTCALPEIAQTPLLQLGMEQGLSFTIHLDDSLDLCNFNPLVRYGYRETLRQALALAIFYDMPVVNIHWAEGGVVDLPDGRHYLYEKYWQAYFALVQELRLEVEDIIGDRRVRVCLENNRVWQGWQKRAISYLLESPVFGLTLDTGHCAAHQNADFAYFIEQKTSIQHMHCHDCQAGVDHLALGAGNSDLLCKFGLADELGLAVVLETKTTKSLLESVEWLKRAGLWPKK